MLLSGFPKSRPVEQICHAACVARSDIQRFGAGAPTSQIPNHKRERFGDIDLPLAGGRNLPQMLLGHWFKGTYPPKCLYQTQEV